MRKFANTHANTLTVPERAQSQEQPGTDIAGQPGAAREQQCRPGNTEEGREAAGEQPRSSKGNPRMSSLARGKRDVERTDKGKD